MVSIWVQIFIHVYVHSMIPDITELPPMHTLGIWCIQLHVELLVKLLKDVLPPLLNTVARHDVIDWELFTLPPPFHLPSVHPTPSFPLSPSRSPQIGRAHV